jgi:O-antigen ligase
MTARAAPSKSMGFILTLIYVSLALLSPVDLAPALAQYRVELLIVVATLLFSVPGLLDSRFFRTPQVYLLAGLFVAVFLSEAFASQWIGGGWISLQRFLPAAIVFYLVMLNCQSVGRLRALVTFLVAIGCFYVVMGARAYMAGDLNSSLLKIIPISDGSVAFRMQGLGFLSDPNELGQFLVMILPLLWVGWRQGFFLQNTLFIVVPTVLFCWGIYLTHSRGAALALVVIIVLALKDRVSWVWTVLVAALALGIVLGINVGGAGREISVEAGADRLALWGDGLRLFRQSPLFGVGYQGFAPADYGHTAHNSFIVCLAELGLVGYTFWVALLVFTFSGLNSLISKYGAVDVDKADTDAEGMELSPLEKTDVGRWARALRLSLIGFLTAAWFLSRAYTLGLYLVLGMAAALLCLAEEREPIVQQPTWRLLSLTARFGFAAIALVYVSLRLRSVLF